MENIDNEASEIYNELAGQGYFVLDPGAVMGYYKKEQMFTKRRERYGK